MVFSQDFSQGAMRLVVFFSCFSLALAQLILSCFADQRPHALKPGHVTVQQNSQTLTVFISVRLNKFAVNLAQNNIQLKLLTLIYCFFGRTRVQLKMRLFSLKQCSGGSVGEFCSFFLLFNT